jgi:superfamily I DNA/RNA helicase
MNENEDIIELDEADFQDTPVEEEVESTPAEPKVEETKVEQTDEQKLLELLKSKVKYNGNSVDIPTIDDVVTNYQKGLNYDALKAKSEKSENAVLDYINTKAKSMNMTPEQYIEKVKTYEAEQIKAKNEKAIAEMTANGVPEDIAREIIETRALRESLQKEKAELEEQKKLAENEKQKDKEFQEFLKAYPGIEVDKIPAEVFENAKSSNLLSAYAQYENKLLKEQLKQMEQNQKNASTSVVSPVGNTADEESKDAFLMGFDS